MRFDITILVASLATISTDDTMTVFAECGPFSIWDSKNAIFYTGPSTYYVDANRSCRGTGVSAWYDGASFGLGQISGSHQIQPSS
ncbi:uncharacterized protein LY79DRAFT_686507 [Colletotrichum navitas]|uniref:Uncharacterized protein n=1 Tax=Colletotrichum navitas TaxID=681940 RepID=A0AAD8PID4_9PEZI|nr:uncharacterized protein LY79DRAFT_686507 [Colletotrichum navitas]KAK1561517.1 hypothetical protein LY79DRAFT_686507 [Colletotrichum navitas]